MEQLIPVINKVYEVIHALEQVHGSERTLSIPLPQLIVVGSQSSGKSSVLECIVGRDFLPRGSSIVTRRPLILQLINNKSRPLQVADRKDSKTPTATPSSTASTPRESKTPAAEWGEFLHRKGDRFENFDDIRDEISRETDRLVGKNKGVSRKPINLKIYSPHVLNLTLVDLPGITKVPVGDQPSDIEAQIREMIIEYITNPLSIIIAVSPGNADLANSDALKLAREVDPHGIRTLGVVTKLDLMDKGTDAMDIILGKVIPLHHGFVGVVNRSQDDINNKKPIHAALKYERQWFQQHPIYRPIASKMGTPYLAQRLNAILMMSIQECLPELRRQIGATIATYQEELESYGTPLNNSPSSLGPLLLHLLSKFCNNFRDALEGKSPDVSLTELYGGARIAYVFQDVFCQNCDNLHPFDSLPDADIRTAIRNATGPRPSLFIPEISFELLVKKQIARLLKPSIDCVDLVFDELKRVASQCEQLSPELRRFPVLRERMLICVRDLLVRCVQPTKQMITAQVNIELGYINTNHPDFIGGSRAVTTARDRLNEEAVTAAKPPGGVLAEEKRPRVNGKVTAAAASGTTGRQGVWGLFRRSPDAPETPAEEPVAPVEDDRPAVGPHARELQILIKPPTERELMETEIIKNLISSYFNIVRKNVQDAIPKSIMHFLVNDVKKSIQSELVKTLYKENMFEVLLKESDDIAEKRAACVVVLDVMQRALDVVNQVRDFDVRGTTPTPSA